MKLKITLSNTGGELDSQTVENPKAVEADDMSNQIHDVIGSWCLSAGDTIKIEEV